MPEQRKSREEIRRLRAKNPLSAEVGRGFVANTLKLLAPIYGYHPAEVVRIDKACCSRGLLAAFKEDAAVGYLVPPGLVIGGVSGIKHTDLICVNIGKQGFIKKFNSYCQEFGQATFVFQVAGSRSPWVIHNIEVPYGKRRHSIMLYAQAHGGSHIQILRIENFIKEFSDEQEQEY